MSPQCPQCGHLQSADVSQCEKCGAALGSTAAVTASPPAPSGAGAPTAFADEDDAAKVRPASTSSSDDESLRVRRDRHEATSSSGAGWIVLIVLLVVGLPVLLLGGCLFLGGIFAFWGVRQADMAVAEGRAAAKVAVAQADMAAADANMALNPPVIDGPDRPGIDAAHPVLADRKGLDPFVNENLKPNDQVGPLAPTAKIWTKLKDAAAKPGQFVESKTAAGHAGNRMFQDSVANNALLIGFFAGSNGEFLQPIYLTSDGEKAGKRYGTPTGNVLCVKAKKGYAVGAIDVRSSDLFHGMNVTFMRVKDESLDVNDSYRSGPVGKNGGEGHRVGGDGKLIVGFHGRSLHAPFDIYPVDTITSLGVLSLR